MGQQVEIPGIGIVEFPDEFTPDQINAASKHVFENQYVGPQQEQPNAHGDPLAFLGSVGKAGLHMGTGIVGNVAGLVAGAPEYAGEAIRTHGEGNGQAAHETVQRVANAMTTEAPSPNSAGGMLLDNPVTRGAGAALAAIGDPTGNGNKYVSDAIQFAAPIAAPIPKLAKEEQIPGTRGAYRAETRDIGANRGYQLPPTGWLARKAELVGGPAMNNYKRAANNEAVTTDIARQELQLPKDADVSPDSVHHVLQGVDSVYGEVANSGLPINLKDPQFVRDVIDLAPTSTGPLSVGKTKAVLDLRDQLLSGSGDSMDNAVTAVRDLREKAKANFRTGTADAKELAGAQWDAAKAIDDQIERTLETASKTKDAPPELASLYDRYTAARKLGAKAHVIDNAMNEGTGSIDPAKIRRQGAKGYLDEGLAEIARVNAAYPKSVRAMENLTEPGLSPFDLYGGVATLGIVPAIRYGARVAARNFPGSGVSRLRLTSPGRMAIDAIDNGPVAPRPIEPVAPPPAAPQALLGRDAMVSSIRANGTPAERAAMGFTPDVEAAGQMHPGAAQVSPPPPPMQPALPPPQLRLPPPGADYAGAGAPAGYMLAPGEDAAAIGYTPDVRAAGVAHPGAARVSPRPPQLALPPPPAPGPMIGDSAGRVALTPEQRIAFLRAMGYIQ